MQVLRKRFSLWLPLLALPLITSGSGLGDLSRPATGDAIAASRSADPVDTQGNPVSVDGSLPTTGAIGESVLAGAADPATLVAVAGPSTQLPAGPLGIPGTALDAYVKAARGMARLQPGCHLDWSLLASIGRIESNHARGGRVDATGTTVAPILGPVLNGAGFAAIADTDGGAYDGDARWDRAVGPMQFIPSTWRSYAADGNGDGRADPSNIYDATLGAGRYLCASGLDTADARQRAIAVFRYNHSDSYVATVLLWADAYARGVHPTGEPEDPQAPLVLLAASAPFTEVTPAALAPLPAAPPGPAPAPAVAPPPAPPAPAVAPAPAPSIAPTQAPTVAAPRPATTSPSPPPAAPAPSSTAPATNTAAQTTTSPSPTPTASASPTAAPSAAQEVSATPPPTS